MTSIFSEQVIRVASISQLAEMYNLAATDLGEKHVKRFPDKKTGIRRLNELLSKKPTKAKAKSKKGMNFNLKGDKQPKFLRGPKPDGSVSTRLRLARILAKGGTFDKIVSKVWDGNHRAKGRTEKWKRKNTYGDIHLLNVECGYGVAEKDGFVKLTTEVFIK